MGKNQKQRTPGSHTHATMTDTELMGARQRKPEQDQETCNDHGCEIQHRNRQVNCGDRSNKKNDLNYYIEDIVNKQRLQKKKKVFLAGIRKALHPFKI